MPRARRATSCLFHHVTTRGNNRRSMYDDREDRETFYAILARALRRSAVLCHLEVLMGNHYHLVLEGAIEDISQLMWDINYHYALAYNARHERINHQCGRRFHATPIADRRGARAVSVYVALNPVRAGFCDHPRDWPYGGYRAYAGIDQPREHLTMTFVEDLFADQGGIVEACDQALQKQPSRRPPLTALLPSSRGLTREHIAQAIRIFGYTHEEIASYYGVSSRSLNRWAAGNR